MAPVPLKRILSVSSEVRSRVANVDKIYTGLQVYEM